VHLGNEAARQVPGIDACRPTVRVFHNESIPVLPTPFAFLF
jgi:hypothetical protein